MIVQKKAQLTGHNASIFSLTSHDASNNFLSGGGEGWVVRWNLAEPELGRVIAKVETQIFSMLSLPDEKLVVVGNMNGGVHWVDLTDPKNTKNIAHHRRGVFGIHRANEFVFTVGGEGLLTKWSIEPIRSQESLHLSRQPLRSIDYCERRQELAVGCSDNNIYLVDAQTLELKSTLQEAHENSVFSVKYHPNGQFLMSGGRDAHLKVWDLSDDRVPISSQPAHWFTINSIAFHPEGRFFATGSRDKTVKIWDAENFKLLKVLETVRDKGHINSVNALYWSDYRNWLLSGGDDRSIIIWEISQTEVPS